MEPSQLQSILAFRPVFRRADFQPGTWVTTPGAFPFVDYHPEVLRFLEVLQETDFSNLSPQYGQAEREEARQYLKEPGRLNTASLEDLRRVLAVHLRAERFGEGIILHLFQSGFLLTFLDRLAELAETEK